MSEVFLCETGQLDARSKRDLRAAGVVVVEVEEPGKCQFIRATETIGHDDMMWACLEALCYNGGTYSKGDEQRERLAQNLFKVIMQARAPEDPPRP